MEHGAAEPKGLKTLDNPPDSSQDMVFLKHVVFPLQPFDPALDEDVFQLDCRLYLLQHLHCTLCTGQLSAVNSCVFIHSPCVPNRVSGHLVAVGVEMTSEDRGDVTNQSSIFQLGPHRGRPFTINIMATTTTHPSAAEVGQC
jgi:hypothetical protein